MKSSGTRRGRALCWAVALAACLLTALPGRAQRGKDGARTVTANSILNEYTTLTADASSGATTISVTNSGLNANSRFAGNLAAGDLVMLIQMQGASISTADDATYGSVTAYNNAGRYELQEVAAVPSGTSITLTCGLSNSYTSAGRVQVIRVPRFTTLTVSSTINAPAWTGSTGGVVALEVQGNITLGNSAYIDVSGAGFRGGALNNNAAYPGTFNGYRTTNSPDGAEKGEGIAGYQTDYDGTGRYGRGAPANGGGGGNSHNAGGGGGSNVGSGTYTGTGIPSRGPSNSYDAAWNQESTNFATSTSPGGGRGGYSYSQNAANPQTQGPGNTAWGGDNRRNVGGLGGYPLDATNRVFMGGGGGAGNENDGVGTAGAPGGGILYLSSGGTIVGSGNTNSGFLANGLAAATAGIKDAAGGAGGGGSIILNTTNSPTALLVSAAGGAGGSQPTNTTNDTEAEGPGGGGGGGFIVYTALAPSVNVSVAGGNSGTTGSPGMTAFPPDGATQGAGGISQTITATAGAFCAVDAYATLSSCPATATTDAPVSYTVTFGNNSAGSAAANTTRVVTLPSGSVVTNAGGGTVSGSSINFGTATIAAGASQTFAFAFTQATPGTYTVTATASVTGSPAEPSYNQANNTSNCSLVMRAATAAPCATPGKDLSPGGGGSNPAALATNPNSYWPSTAAQTLTAGSTTTINLGPANTNGALTNLAAGDLVLLMQMQGGDINSTNTTAYGGGGSSANGALAYTAGTYEYAVVASSTTTTGAGGSITLTVAVRNGYVSAAATNTAGQRTFQVVRIPQYTNLTLGGNLTAAPWNGQTGGILALDVAGQLNLAGFTINATGAGFRGGAGRILTGDNTGTATNADYRSSASLNAHGTKGEGLAGTPRYVNDPANSTTAPLDTRATTTGYPTLLAAGQNDGYPNGDNARGAPGNAGGGGTDNSAIDNSQNSGGGGGANGGAGGQGGNTWNSNAALGGQPGAAFAAVSNRLVLGGGGGSGVTNNGSTSGNGFNSSGAAGGGIVLVRTGTVTGTGNITANGVAPTGTPANDGGGGGGAGGSILLTASSSTASLTGITLSAIGGNGGSNTGGGAGPHGPGGGGGGGVLLSTSAVAAPSSAAAGFNGTTQGNIAYGATAGAAGQSNASTSNLVGNSVAGAGACRQPPVANNVTTNPVPNTAGQAGIGSLSATSVGSIISYTVVTVPNATTQGTLYYNSTGTTYVAVAAGQQLTPAQAASLRFTPVSGASGNATFTYTATDDVSNVSNPATYTIPLVNTACTTGTLAFSTRPANEDWRTHAPLAVPTGSNTTTLSSGSYTTPNTAQTSTFNTDQLNGVQTLEWYTSYGNKTDNTSTVTFTFNRPVSNLQLRVQDIDRFEDANSAFIDQVTFVGANGSTTVTPVLAPLNANNNSVFINGNVATGTVNVTDPTNGTLVATFPSPVTSYTLTYRNISTAAAAPTGNAVGIDQISFCTQVALANNDNATTPFNTAVTLPVLANDTPTAASNDPTAINPATIDLDPNTPGIQQGTAGAPIAVANGTAYVNASNQVVFTPATGFSGPTSFVYTVSDNSGQPTNQATVAVSVTAPNPDLQVLLAPNSNPSVAGQPVTLTVTSQNNGPGTATNVVPTVRIPTGLPVSGATAPQLNGAGPTGTSSGNATYANGATYNPGTGVVIFPTIASQASGTGSNVANTVTFNTPVNGPVALTANVSNGKIDANPANNTASLSLNVTPSTDLATTITGPTSAPQPGDLVSYAVTTSNNGPSVANGVVQTVQLPTGLNGVYATNGGTYNANNGLVTFPAQTLFSGEAVGNTVSFAAPALGTVLAPTASVPTTNDPATGNNTSTAASQTVTAPSALAANTNVIIVASAATATPGTAINYTVTAANNGPAAATNVVTTVNIGPGRTVSNLPLGASYSSTTGIVTLPVTALASGTNQAFTFTVTAPAAGPLTATATVASNESDPTLADNVATTITTINGPGTSTGPDVVTTLTAPASVPAGQPLTYTVTTVNNGTDPATGVAQTVQLPTGLTGVSVSNNGTYSPTTGLVTFPTVATLSPGAGNVLTNTITVNAPASGPLNAVAATSTTSPDTMPGNNTAGTSTSVTPVSDLSVALSSPPSATTGQLVTYGVTTTNNGPSLASNVAPTAQLPTGLSNVTVRDAQGNVVANAYNAATGVVTLPIIASLPAGAASANTATITFVVPSTTQLDIATLVPTTNDPNAANNTTSTATPVTAPSGNNADLVTTLTSNVTTQTAGQPVSYTVTTTNNGPADAQNVQQTVQLPTGLTGVSVSNGGTYSPTTGLVTFPAMTTLTNGSNTANTITVNAPGAGPLVASANSTSSNPDPTPANNGIQATPVTVTQTADVVTTLSGPASAQPGAPVSYAVTTSNNGPSAAASVTPTATLPSGLAVTGANPVRINGQVPQSVSGSGVATYPDGSTYNSTSGAVTLPVIASLGSTQPTTNVVSFAAPTAAYSVQASGNSATTNDPNTANNTATPMTTNMANVLPLAQFVVNTLQSPQGNTAGQLPISPLAATDADGTIASYQLTRLPDPTQGVLYYNNSGTYTALTAVNLTGGSSPVNLTPTQAGTLRFAPVAGYVGNASFTYTATDNVGGVSNGARYRIPVNSDNASQYTNTPPKGGANSYATNDVLAYVIDPNGARYNAAGAIYNGTGVQQTGTSNGLPTSGTNAVLAPIGSGPSGNTANTLPPGISLNPITGQIFVSNAAQLPRITTATPYSVNVTTTDLYGGITTQTVTFTLGAYPLPVTLVAFDVRPVQNRDALLSWTTASEANNDHFDVERSLDGRTFVMLGQLQGQGSKASATNYSFTDAGIGLKEVVGLPVYYRLRQVDLSGTSTYSPVRTVSFAGISPVAVTLFPNPASTATSLDLTALPVATTYQAVLLDATGRQVCLLTLSGGLVQPLPIQELATGTYTILLSGAAPDGTSARFVLRLMKE